MERFKTITAKLDRIIKNDFFSKYQKSLENLVEKEDSKLPQDAPCMHYKAYLEDVQKGYVVDSYLKSGCDICKGYRHLCQYYTP